MATTTISTTSSLEQGHAKVDPFDDLPLWKVSSNTHLKWLQHRADVEVWRAHSEKHISPEPRQGTYLKQVTS